MRAALIALFMLAAVGCDRRDDPEAAAGAVSAPPGESVITTPEGGAAGPIDTTPGMDCDPAAAPADCPPATGRTPDEVRSGEARPDATTPAEVPPDEGAADTPPRR